MKINWHSWWYEHNIFKVFRIHTSWRDVHTGIGHDTGDGVNIQDKVIEFGEHPFIWLQIRLWTKVITYKNKWFFTFFGNNNWEILEGSVEDSTVRKELREQLKQVPIAVRGDCPDVIKTLDWQKNFVNKMCEVLKVEKLWE